MRPIEYITEWTGRGPFHGPVFKYLYALEHKKNIERLAKYVTLRKNPTLIRALSGRIFASYEAFISVIQVKNYLIKTELSYDVVNYIFELIIHLALRTVLVKEEV